jgi:hypothetical protein
MAHEWKKAEKKYYLPGKSPEMLRVPKFNFFSVKGKGDPNDKSFGEYISVLYSLSYAVKMSPRQGNKPDGYYEYSVYPLEGVWDISEEAKRNPSAKIDKSTLVFNLMIRQPDFVTDEFAEEIIEKTKKKKPHPLLESVIFISLEEGPCVQMLHLGSYDDEPVSFKKMEDYCNENNFTRMSKTHREIYLSDARKVTPDKLKTVLRFKILLP